jgi:S-formylglutathione hydrolase FrmB
MGLTSGSFAILMFVLAAAGLVAVVVCWPLAARGRIRDIAARLLMVIASQLLVIAAFLVFLNGYFGFYESWSQLLGSGTPRIVGLARASNSRAPLLTITGVGSAPVPGRPDPTFRAQKTIAVGHYGSGEVGAGGSGQMTRAQTGELLQVSITGQHTGIAVSGAYVYLPPQYFQPAYARASFPVLLALSGYPGASWSIIRRLGLPAAQEALLSQGKIKPVIDVMMNSSVAMPRDTECTNIPAGPQVETFFAEDVPEAIEHAFRAQAGGWAAIGYSTGGYCAVKLAMMNPRQFPLAVSLAGYYQALQDGTTGDLYGGSIGYRDENSPDWRLRNLPAPPISVLVASSVIGETTYPGTLVFVKLVRAPMRVYTLYLPQGGHNFHTWNRELLPALRWLSQRQQPAGPSSLPVGTPG